MCKLMGKIVILVCFVIVAVLIAAGVKL